MRKLCVVLWLAGLFAMSSAQAAMQVTLYQDLSNYSSGNGGEFNAVPNVALLSANPTLSGYSSATADLLNETYFQTFCIETMEYFSPGSTYNVTISDKILYNAGQFPSGGPITLGTAWLYSQFAAGTLNGYDYTYGSGRTATAGDLQQAIWYLQGEAGLINGGADGTTFYNDAVSALGGTVGDPANGAYGVFALNMWTPNEDGSNGAAAQDQLMVVPEPTTVSFGFLFLLPFGLSKVRAFFRRQTV